MTFEPEGLTTIAERFAHPLGAAVHAILWIEWDPIGVSGIAPDDEYDNYVMPVIERIERGETIDEIAAYLDWLASDYMGLSNGNQEHSVIVARKLLALKPVEGD
ncbi:MAG: hypothetical protein Q7J28_05305 [Caulobacter sp.]|nr:hypothetical protein [Caulobacter sp.]